MLSEIFAKVLVLNEKRRGGRTRGRIQQGGGYQVGWLRTFKRNFRESFSVK
jgi:hypothetical protein